MGPGRGGLQPAPLNAPPAGLPAAGVQPGVSQAVIFANRVIVFGTGEGVFVYNGTPALGNPPIAWMGGGLVDPYGNVLPSTTGVADSGTFQAGNTVIYPGGLVGYAGTPAANNMLYSFAPAQFTDPFGNNVLLGETTYWKSGSVYWATETISNSTLFWSSATAQNTWVQQGAYQLAGSTTNAFSVFPPAAAGLSSATLDGSGFLELINSTGISEILGIDAYGFFKTTWGFIVAQGFGASQYVFLPPSGDTTGATDTANINRLLVTNQFVHLLPGDFYINAPIVIPGSNVRLTGDIWWSASQSDNYSQGGGFHGGANIIMTPTFAGAAAIYFPDPGAGVQNYGVDISGISIEGFEVAAGTIYGVYVVGAWGACFLRGVAIHRPPADCLRAVSSPATGKVPDSWTITECKFSASRNGNGVYLAEMPDSIISDCESSENELDGWYVNYGVNTRFTACRGENNRGNGWHITGMGPNEIMWFTGSDSANNFQNGWLFDNNGPSHGSASSTYLLTGCVSATDGLSSTTAGYAGFNANDAQGRVILGSCATTTNGSEPQFAAVSTNSYGLAAIGCSLQAVNPGMTNGGGNTNAPVDLNPVPF